MIAALRRALIPLAVLMLAGLCACAAPPPPPPPAAAPAAPPPPPPPPTVLQVDINALPSTNPDARGRPSPVVLRFYELKSLTPFTTADYFALADKDQQTLGAELVAREEFQLIPGDQRRFERKLQADTRYIGVVAAFRDLEKAQWRATIPVAPNRTSVIEVKLDASKVTITSR